eukprot:TRINITY_DN242_c10_g1_i1.p1 TRINITY_DN242_c10_g1~~TRINITY_DN242_c10_g1_i1.p1  ORF type:complete len:146 (-),score=44.15 TRINITY_DN242_c10_g1_i1:36-473(-)
MNTPPVARHELTKEQQESMERLRNCQQRENEELSAYEHRFRRIARSLTQQYRTDEAIAAFFISGLRPELRPSSDPISPRGLSPRSMAQPQPQSNTHPLYDDIHRDARIKEAALRLMPFSQVQKCNQQLPSALSLGSSGTHLPLDK